MMVLKEGGPFVPKRMTLLLKHVCLDQSCISYLNGFSNNCHNTINVARRYLILVGDVLIQLIDDFRRHRVLFLQLGQRIVDVNDPTV